MESLDMAPAIKKTQGRVQLLSQQWFYYSVDGQPRKRKAPGQTLTLHLSPGAHKITLENPEAKTQHLSVQVKRGQNKEIPIQLERKSMPKDSDNSHSTIAP